MDQCPRQLSARRCDFGGARDALAEFVGGRVGVEVSPLNGSGPFLTAIGELTELREIGGRGWEGLAFEVGEAGFRMAASTFASGSREEYADGSGQMRWRLVAVELRFGVVIEVEEIPRGHETP